MRLWKIKDQRGQALVEFALVVPLIMMLLMGIVEFGRIYSAQLIINNAVRDGARVAAVGADDTTIIKNVTDICTANSLKSSELTVTVPTIPYADRSIGDTVSVGAEYKVALIVPFIRQAIDLIDGIDDDKYKVSAQVSMRFE